MIDYNLVRIDRNKRIRLNEYKVVAKRYLTHDRTDFEEIVSYMTEIALQQYRDKWIAQHQLWEIDTVEELDTSEIAWLDGIQLRTQDTAKEIAEIAEYGSVEAYEASLPEARDQYNIELDYRLSKLELGI